tara:strand:- start:2175 stop:3551 length:1377 start_codon:yes stop_codon:yes gene_type:complete
MNFRYKAPEPVDKSLYQGNINNLTAYYGLPTNVKFCSSCVISNQRPSSTIEFKNDGKAPKKVINFNQNDICDACLVRKDIDKIDWKKREEILREICKKYRKNDGNYDCLVPGSGGKDSFMTAHLLKYKYGMNPLTCTWAPHIYTDWGWANHQAWIDAGFDNILFTPNGKIHKFLTRLATENLFYPFQPFILGQKNIAPKIASQYGIKLIFYGENQAEYGNPKSDNKNPKMSDSFFTKRGNEDIFLGGTSIEELKEIGIKSVDINPYLPIDQEKLEKEKIEYFYLGYFERWHPQGAYYYSVQNGKFQSSPERTCGTFNTYNSIDDKVDDFHYHTTFIKFGIGRATYDAAQEIRSGDLMREEGISLVKKFDGEFPMRWASQVFEYLSISKKEFPILHNLFEKPLFDKEYYDLLTDKFRSPHLWKWDEEKGWDLRYKIYEIDKENIQETTANLWQGNKDKR